VKPARMPLSITARDIIRFRNKVEKCQTTGCWFWRGLKSNNGYGIFSVKTTRFGAHRFSVFLDTGCDPKDLNVCHKCDTPLCVNPDHLFLGTQKENMVDMGLKGRRKINPLVGENQAHAKLRDDDVFEIRRAYAANEMNQVSLAKKYGVKQANISRIVLGMSWKHLLPQESA
jgi:hypothetical protein